MRFMKVLFIPKGLFKLISILIFFYSINNLIVFGFDDKSNSINENKNDYDFEKVLFQNSIPYEEYDSIPNQLKLFFGYSSKEPEKILFSDYLIINSSRSMRELYKLKMKDMTKIKLYDN